MLIAKQRIIERAISENRTILTEIESKELLREEGISVIETRMALSKEETIFISKQFGFPLALKIVSPSIVHKSDAGAVTLGLKTSKQLGKAYDDILRVVRQERPDAVIQGVSVQKMARPGVEVIIGMFKDTQFGPVIMFGLGGILVEILKDISFRIVPLTKRDAKEMIREIRGYPLLEGYRGRDPVDVSNLEELLLRVSRFVDRNPEIKELDLNPIFAYSDGAVAVDARVVLEKAQ